MQQLSEILSALWNHITGVWLVVVLLAVVLVTFLTLVLTGHMQTGFAGKTIWDWIEVVGVPFVVVLVGGVFAIGAQRAGQRALEERERDTERAREASLREYLDRMSELILNHKLHESPEGSPARAVADAQTLGTLRSLNGPRKGIVV